MVRRGRVGHDLEDAGMKCAHNGSKKAPHGVARQKKGVAGQSFLRLFHQGVALLDIVQLAIGLILWALTQICALSIHHRRRHAKGFNLVHEAHVHIALFEHESFKATAANHENCPLLFMVGEDKSMWTACGTLAGLQVVDTLPRAAARESRRDGLVVALGLVFRAHGSAIGEVIRLQNGIYDLEISARRSVRQCRLGVPNICAVAC
mmetsp:Transcript_130517/g.278931  ORF Transcript_130517/g.278931 Transcript_130517/m.278931 type:complete len:206 (+) Transcript_130517:453-1070(+)